MELTGDILIAAPREKVWAGLNDPEVLVRCIPGCEGMEATSPTERTARVAVKVGPVRARFVGHIRMEDVRVNQGCTLQFEGSGGAAGMARGHSNVTLTDEAGGTRLSYTTQASVGGKLGQVGGRMIDAAAKQMADQFFAAFNAQMAEPVPTATPAEAAAVADVASVSGAAPEQAAVPTAPTAATAAAPATAAEAAPAAASVTPAPTSVIYRPAPPSPPVATPVPESVRVLWFALGALSTGFGVWIASLLNS